MIVVPVKALAGAKSRLVALSAEARAALVTAMLEDVLDAAAAAHDGPRLVLSPDEGLAEVASAHGAGFAVDAGSGYNAAIAGVRRLPALEAAGALVVLPGDVPRARPEEIARALEALASHDVVLVRAHDDGTGLLGLRPPEVMPPAFGPRSADAHRQQAETRGLSYVELDCPSLALDIDAIEDLEGSLPPLGPRTAAFVERELRGLGL